jgi:peptidyl-prolyl cis-trans isomerase SurA
MRKALGALLLAVGLAAAPAAAQTPFQPVATVNDSVITAFDLDQRMRILAAGAAETADTQALRNRALDQLIDDRLRLQAGERAGLEPSPDIVEAGVRLLAEQSGTTPETFRAGLREQGVTDQALDDMVAARMIWREVARSRFGDRVEPGEAEIDAEIALRNEGRTVSLRLAEIGLPSGADGRGPEETRALARRLSRELAAGGDFAAAVARHSRAPSRENGGEIGWVPVANLPPAIASRLSGVPVGGVAQPLEVEGGFSILKVLDRRVEGGGVDADNPELRDRVRQRLVGERIGRLAQGLLQELRRDALIEIRR